MSERTFFNHVIQYDKAYSLCLGCESCEIICSLVHNGTATIGGSGIHVQRDTPSNVIHTLLVCQQCSDHPCYNACPKKDKALYIDERGYACIKEENCIGCGLCARACVFDPPRIRVQNRKAHKCDLCKDRPEGPACIQYCPALTLGLSENPLPYKFVEEGKSE